MIDANAHPPHVPGREPRSGAIYSDPTDVAVVVIADAKLSDTIFVGWTANYVQYLEWGHSSQAPAGFVGISAEEWPAIVAEVTDELKDQINGS
jgi:hypothetical protein